MPAKDYSCSSQGKLKTGVRKPEATNIVVEPWMGKSQRGESSDCLPMSLTDPSTTHVWNRLSDGQLRSELGPELLPKKQNIKFKHSQKKESSLSRVWLFETPWTVADQAPPSMGFSRQEYWSGLPFPSSGNLPDPGIELKSPAWQVDSLPLSHPGCPHWCQIAF